MSSSQASFASRRARAGGSQGSSNSQALHSINADVRLSYMFQFAGLDETEIDQIVKNGIRSFSSLLSKVNDLKKAKLRFIQRKRQQTLSKCVLWYEEYCRVYKKEPDWKNELTEDALIDFEGNGYSIPFAEGESLKHIFTILHSNNNDLQHRLADAGISTFDDVIKNRQHLEKGTFGEGIKSEGGSSQQQSVTAIPKKFQKELAQVVDWFDEFLESTGRQPNIIQELNEEVFEIFVKEHAYRYNLDAQAFYDLTKVSIHEKQEPIFLRAFPDDKRKLVVDKIMKLASQDVLDNYVSPTLKKVAPERLEQLITYFLERIMNFRLEDSFRTPLVIHGDMQSGKSAVTAVGLAVCRALKVPCVVTTKGRSECLELVAKLQDFAPEGSNDLVMGLAGRRKPKADIRRILENGGTFVAFDSRPQFDKLNAIFRENWEGKKFCAQIDEADAMYRTYDRSQKFETAFDQFIGLRPTIRAYITATPVPALLALKEEKTAGEIDDIDFWSFSPGDDYIGVDDMRPLKDEDGNNVFINQGELTCSTPKIPYTSDAVLKLYLDAAKPEKKRVLLLDVTNNRVRVHANVFDKAKKVQAYLKEECSVDIAVVCVVGSGIKYRLPGQGWEECEKETKVYDALAIVERGGITNEVGDDETSSDGETASTSEKLQQFDGPIFVFGFGKMRRGISYRSPTRVPTHIVLHMGTGHHIESIVQTLGRGAFNGRHLLQETNGHSHVTVLMPSGDWDMVQAHQKYIREVHRRCKLGVPVLDAMTGVGEELPACANYLQHTIRRTGLRAKSKPNAFDSMLNPSFEAPTQLAEGEMEKAKWYADEANVECYRVFKICRELWWKNPKEFEAADVRDVFNDLYREKVEIKDISMTTVGNHLRKHIVKDGLINEKPGEKKSQRYKRYSLDGIEDRVAVFLTKVKELRKSRRRDLKGKRKADADSTEPENASVKSPKIEDPSH